MPLPTAEEFLISVRRIRDDSARHADEVRRTGTPAEIRASERQMTQAQKLLDSAERRFGI